MTYAEQKTLNYSKRILRAKTRAFVLIVLVNNHICCPLIFYWVSSFSPVNGSDHRSSQKPNEQRLLPTLRHSDPSYERSFNEGLGGQLSLKVVTLQKMNLENELCKATKCANSNSIGTSLSGAFMGGGCMAPH